MVSAVAWMALLRMPAHAGRMLSCSFHPSEVMPVGASLRMTIAATDPPAVAAGWVLMLLAMMSPMLLDPLQHIIMRSLWRLRLRMCTAYVAGYGSVWMAAGLAFMAVEAACRCLLPRPWLGAAVALVAACIWQCSPWKQRALNSCHMEPPLAAFGLHAYRSALRFGVTQGMWCFTSCWLLMLVPMLLPNGRTTAMFAAMLLMFSERLNAAAGPQWRVRGPGPALRFLVARLRAWNVLLQPLPRFHEGRANKNPRTGRVAE